MLATTASLLVLLALVVPNRSGRGCLLWTVNRVFNLLILLILLRFLFLLTR
jgi:hypothetical protein